MTEKDFCLSDDERLDYINEDLSLIQLKRMPIFFQPLLRNAQGTEPTLAAAPALLPFSA